ncbi:hypothetical protein DY000_02060177 [Brassica cretica]|uniref:Uncharacterized protein n=1 Tax=Brassica cretica TaxID=69181 RepID=A0ABQ7AWH9_BRACR|nr:hypothetical protein DY000_02060177 [Brassica cretica]
MQQCEHSTLYEYSIFPKFQVELKQTNSQCSRLVWMWRNEVGVVGIYRYLQRVTSSHTRTRVSACMLPVTCAATHGYTHVVRHVPETCRETHPRPHVPQHAQPSCVATHRPLHVSPHAQFPDTATPRATTCQAACSAPMHVYTLSLC